MIIIEGIDRCGKSTVVKALLKLLPSWSYRHHTRPPMAPYGYFAGFLADCRPRVIVDRLHWSEVSYGKTFRGVSDLTSAEYMKLELMCLAQDATVIYMEDDVESIRGRWDEKEMFPASGIEKLAAEYEQVISTTKLPFIRAKLHDLVTPSGKPTDALAKIAILESKRAQITTNVPPPSIGAGCLRKADFFVIGPSPTLSGIEKDPDVQFPLPLGHAENAFWEAMKNENWGSGYYTNVSNYSGTELTQLLGFPKSQSGGKPRKVIALGVEASVALDKIGCRNVALTHPTTCMSEIERWCKRFHELLSRDWEELLEEQNRSYENE